MNLRFASCFLLATILVLTSCTPKTELASTPTTPPAVITKQMVQHDNLNALLWVQTAAEYVGLTSQAYTTAQLALDEALEDPTWTASIEQAEMEGFDDLPPGVILDVDETVLDNSAYQARLIQTGTAYSSASWAAWCAEEAAPGIPGALNYCKEASARGITVFYVTNRKAKEEAATRNNLKKLGFPLAEGADVIITRGEQPAWASSDKTPRRAFIAKNYRILQLVGDNLGDFLEAEGAPQERVAAANRYADYWGMRWIVLPNPTYGNWEGALFGGDRSLSAEQQREKKVGQLRQ